MPASTRVVLLDRDGVINADSPDHIRSPGAWEALPGSLDGIARLHGAGFAVAVCTNQSGLARGLFTPRDLAAIHARMETAVTGAGGELAGIFVCPHGPEAGCDCRKPQPGLLLRALRALGATPQQAVFIGDSTRDLQAAEAAGVTPWLVLTGNGQEALEGWGRPVTVHDDLAGAARALIESEGGMHGR